MNQKEKILIGLTSLFCGTPLIFLTFRDNQNQKNNLSFKKEEKKKNQQKSTSSFLFWIVFVVLLLVFLTIICYVIYQSRQKAKKFPGTDQDSESEKQSKKTIKSKTVYLSPEIVNFLNQKKKEKELKKENKALKQKKICLYFTPKNSYQLLLVKNSMDTDSLQESAIEDILKDDIRELSNFRKLTSKEENNLKKKLREFIQKLIDFLTTYLTGQILDDIYQDYLINKTDYEILTEMVKKIEATDTETINLILHTENFQTYKELEYKPLFGTDNLTKLSKEILRKSMEFNKIYFNKNEKGEKCYLFRNFFILKRLTYNIFLKLSEFMKRKSNYKKTFEKIIDDTEKIDNLLYW